MCGPLHPSNNNLALAFAYPLQAHEFPEGVCTGMWSGERLLISKPHRQGLRFWGFFCESWPVWQFVLWGACCSVFQLPSCIRRQIKSLFCHVSCSCPCLEREVGRKQCYWEWEEKCEGIIFVQQFVVLKKIATPGLGVYYFRELWSMKKVRPFVFSLNFLSLKQSLKENWQKKRKKWKI